MILKIFIAVWVLVAVVDSHSSGGECSRIDSMIPGQFFDSIDSWVCPTIPGWTFDSVDSRIYSIIQLILRFQYLPYQINVFSRSLSYLSRFSYLWCYDTLHTISRRCTLRISYLCKYYIEYFMIRVAFCTVRT